MILLTWPTHDRLEAILARSQETSPTYESVGATRKGDSPIGYQRDSYSIRLGNGKYVWERAVAGLRQWVAHTGAGARVVPADAPIAEKGTILVVLSAGPLHAVAPCRIVYVIDEPNRFGFGYGTLPGHPERGEESFVIERDLGGDVRFIVTAFSRPAQAVAKLGAPIARLIQRRVTKGYLEALRRHVFAAE